MSDKLENNIDNLETGVYLVGTMQLGDKVDVTDPCYSKKVWCRKTLDCQPGSYFGYVTVDNTCGYNQVHDISIYKDDVKPDDDDIYFIDTICVDSGMAGFFNNKPDFSNEQWNELCIKTDDGGSFWSMFNGLFSGSGYGDGQYPVYANEEGTVFRIIFIDEEYEYEDENFEIEDEEE